MLAPVISSLAKNYCTRQERYSRQQNAMRLLWPKDRVTIRRTQTGRQTDRQTNKNAYRQIETQKDTQKHGYTNTQTNRHRPSDRNHESRFSGCSSRWLGISEWVAKAKSTFLFVFHWILVFIIFTDKPSYRDLVSS